jgi:hypothetical protein
MSYKRFILSLLTMTSIGLAVRASSQQATSATPPAIDRDTMAVLDKMGTYLRTLQAFQIRSTTTTEDVLDDGQKIQTDGTVDLLVRKPDRLRVEIVTDAQHRMFFYDGKTFTIFARLVNYYATVPAPPTLAELVDRLADNYNIELPLVDLFYWGTDKNDEKSITAATDVGPSEVDGVTCEHYAFRQPGLDWQIWIQNGEYPLPRKLVLTTLTDEARPQYSTVMNWNLAPSYNDEAFVFVAPPDAQKITLATGKEK